ncbi:MAG TPA: pyruvate kinase [Polyangiaceae bacterium LLY-WYZ-14_1]|nr:pyruvate kinase [Polyangiaceae bacterium LLY-WYZ-14_1]
MAGRRTPPPTLRGDREYPPRAAGEGEGDGRAARERELDELLRRLLVLRGELVSLERAHRVALAQVPASSRPSAANLLHYLALRRHDLRPLQGTLWRRGLSSLGRAEARVLPNLDAVIAAVHQMGGRLSGPEDGALLHSPTGDHDDGGTPTIDEGSALLEGRANRTLGPLEGDRASRIMVTMPRESAYKPGLVVELAQRGMGLVRINTAHDDPETWRGIVANVRRAERVVGRRLRIAFDLAGPKLRTGPLSPGPRVARFRPERDAWGRVERPARVAFVPESNRPERYVDRAYEASGVGETGQPSDQAAPTVDLVVPLTGAAGKALLRKARRGDTLLLEDARGRKRRLSVEAIDVPLPGASAEAAVVGICARTGYVVPGSPIWLLGDGRPRAGAEVGDLPATEAPLLLALGDRLRLDRAPLPGANAQREPSGRVLFPAHVSCPVPEVFRDARVGQRIRFDDGEIQGVIREASPDALEIEVTRVAGGTGKLRSEKGINLPDTVLEVPAMTLPDRESLAAIARDADLVSLSYVQRPEDVDDLADALAAAGRDDVGIILKIETERAFRSLPAILFRALARRSDVAVMVARGDLAVEVGFERLAEIQEEILWLAEAAHVPAIWATQVLESLAKRGVPSRAEVTDAVAGTRAECVMLNKGPHVGEAIAFLVDVIDRSRGHQEKKRPMLRRLRVADFDQLS